MTSKDLSLPLKLRLVKCYIYPIVLYGSETWTLLKESEKRVEAFEMWLYRRLAKISWKDKVRNEDVLTRLGVQRELLPTLQTNKLTYFGHIARHDCLPRSILMGIHEGKRKRGRPRRMWTNDIKDWTNRSMTDCMHLTQDRVTWRAMARQPWTEDT